MARYSAVLFDMFDTLVRLDRNRLPAVQIGGREVRSSVPQLHRKWTADPVDRMDEDLNGIPCETTYPSSEVEAYWG